MTVKDSVKFLLDNDYAIIVNRKLVLTDKLSVALDLGVEVSTPQILFKTSQEVVTVSKSTDYKDIWNKFIEDSEVPHRVKSPTDGGSYTVRQYSQANARKLANIVNDEEIDYNRLVQSTKNYYRTVSYKALLSNYIEKGIWKDEYDNWKENELQDGAIGNRWED